MQEAIAETIACMDEYFLGKDDWDNMVELGVGHMREENIIKKIPTAVKTAFTRKWVCGCAYTNVVASTRLLTPLHSIAQISQLASLRR